METSSDDPLRLRMAESDEESDVEEPEVEPFEIDDNLIRVGRHFLVDIWKYKPIGKDEIA